MRWRSRVTTVASPLLPLLLVAGRCQGYDELSGTGGGPVNRQDGGDGGGAPADDGRVVRCRPMSLGAAPRECADTFDHAGMLYPSCTADDPSGYRARCGAFAAAIVVDGSSTVTCYYDRGTGNLALTLEADASGERCISLDPTLEDVPPEPCEPLGATACADGGT